MTKTLIKYLTLTLTLVGSTAAVADYPVGYQDTYTVRTDESARLEILSNDTGDSLRIASFNEWTVKGGRVSIDDADLGNRRGVLYSSPRFFVGEDEFWYVLEDAQGRRNAAKVKITVKPGGANDANPQNDQVSVKKNTAIRINVLENDNEPLNNPRAIARITEFNSWSQKGGQIKRVDDSIAAGQLEYTPKPGFVGVDEFWYVMVTGSNGVPEAAKVTVNVTEYDSSGPYPVAKPDNPTYLFNTRDTDYRYFPLDNDVGKNLRISSRSGYSQKGGRYTVTGVGTLRYIQPASFGLNGGEDKIWYNIEDAYGRKNWSVINFTIPPFPR